MNISINKLLTCLLVIFSVEFSTSIVNASGDYQSLEGYPVNRCRWASSSKTKTVQPLPRGENCSINVNYYYSGDSIGQELIAPKAYEVNFKTISFWVEYREPRSKGWKRVSPIRKLLRNGITKQINFKPNATGLYRVAFDTYDQDFADSYSERFALTIK